MSGLPRVRVLFVIGSMGGGGAERQVLEILKRLDRSRFELVLYLANKQGELLCEVPADVSVFAYWDGLPETPIRKILRLMKLTRLMRQVRLARLLHEQRIDVIYDRTYLATLDAAGGCWLRPTPRVSCCVADPGPELELHARWSVSLAWWFARRAYRTASIVLANSEGLRQRVLEYFRLTPSHVHVFFNLLAEVRKTDATMDPREIETRRILNRIDPRLVTEIPLDVSGDTEAPSVPSQDTTLVDELISYRDELPFLIVNAGRLHPQKGHRFLLEAVDELVHRRGRILRLVVFGVGESESELHEFVRSRHLESSITMAGFVADPRHWYCKADLFVLPSLFEGMPNALIEAVASGIPVLSTDCPSGPKEILDGGRCGGLVRSGDSIALADGIADAMDHLEEWRSRAVLAKHRVDEMFDATKGTRRLEDLLEQVAGRHPITVEAVPAIRTH